MKYWERLVIIAVLAAVMMLAVIIAFGARSQTTTICMGTEEREAIRKLALDAIDQAFQDQVKHLFDVWMKDQSEQPKRASAGMQTAISAHVRARADTMKWNVPTCH